MVLKLGAFPRKMVKPGSVFRAHHGQKFRWVIGDSGSSNRGLKLVKLVAKGQRNLNV